jgi:uncharacterized protein (DUF488 family)
VELFTIGHSNYEIKTFISLLQKHGVTAVADVRSSPYSRFLPHFNRASLKETLEAEGIRYVFLGRELGARPKKQECYVDGKAVYEKIAATDEFHEGIRRVLKGVKKHRLSLMCAEKDPLTCHRAILVCQHLRHFNLQIEHILRNGDLEPHSHLEQRMLEKHRFTEFAENKEEEAQLSLFAQQGDDLPLREECLREAYRLQGDDIAYVERRSDDHEQSNQSIHNRVHAEERSKIL